MAEETHRSDESIAHDTTEVASTDRSADGERRTGDSVAESPPSFGPDAIVGERYRIVRFLARGGMGEVYEAEDATLHQRVALKAIAPEVAQDKRMIARLKREVLLARKVTHANVCRLHDLGFHTGPSGTMAFLTMDLLRGDTLAAYVARERRLTERQALPLVKQMAAALDAAHAAGVIHRDFKSRNVMLQNEAGGARRAVVMDFGIAIAAEEEERQALDTGEGKFIGTPAYMAPEQVSGAPVSPATDVYALGVVMFEMVTGTLPFAASRALESITMRLTQPPPSPRSRVPALDRRWEAAILRCLERDPARRFASAGAVVTALEAPPRFWTRGRALGVAGVALAIAGAAGVRAYRAARPAGGEVAGEAKRRPTIAVVAMKDEARRADSEWLATALTEMLGTDLGADEALRVVPASRVATARRDLGLAAPDAPPVAGPTLARVRENLGVDYVIAGRYSSQDDGALRVELSLVDARTGAAIAGASAQGSTARLADVVSPLGAQLRAPLGARDPTAAQKTAALAASPSSPESARAFAEGEAKLHVSDYVGALAAYERAVTLDPSFPLAHLGLARACVALGYDQRGLEESRRAFEMSRGLSREQQLVIEGRYRATAKEWDRAIEVARTLFEFFPDDDDYAPPYLHALVAAGRAKEALAVIDRIHAGPSPGRDDPRVDLYEAIAATRASDRQRLFDASRRAIEKGERTGALSVAADGHEHLGEAYEDMARWDDARAEFEKARAIYVQTKDRGFEAGILADIAHLDSDRGDAARALPLLEQSLALSREVGARYEVAGRVLDVATVAWMLGDLPRARAMFEESRGLYEAIHDREWAFVAVGRLGRVLADEGDLAAARKRIEEARSRLLEVDAQSLVFSQVVSLVDVHVAAGDLASAAKEQAMAEKLAAALDDATTTARANLAAAGVAREAGDAATARRLGEAARDAFRAQGLTGELVPSLVLLARVALDEGRVADAVPLATEAADLAHPRGLANDEARALATLAAARFAAGDRAGSQAALDRATAVGPTSFDARAALDIARALLAAASGAAARSAESAPTSLAEVRKRCEAAGYVVLALEARLAASPPGPGRAAERARIAAAATDKGLARLARRARP